MTYCDKSVLVPYCSNKNCQQCRIMERKNKHDVGGIGIEELPRKVVGKNQHEEIMQQQGTSKYNY